MKNLKILQSICLSDKNVDIILNIIRNNIKLSTNLATKCIEVIRKIMTRNIGKINRIPSTKSEMKVVIKHLNKLCVNEIIELLMRKYPERCIRKKSSKGRLEEDVDVYGNQEVHINDRPKHTRKSRANSEYSDEPNSDLYGYDSASGFASAFGDHLIIDPKMRKLIDNFPSNNKDDNESIEKRYQQMLNERKLESKNEKPETPDLSLDGSGERAKKERMMRKMEESNMGNMNQSMQMMMDDPYASLLGSGAPMNFGSMDSMYEMNKMEYSNMNSTIQNQYDQELKSRNLQGNMNLPINNMMSMNYMQ